MTSKTPLCLCLAALLAGAVSFAIAEEAATKKAKVPSPKAGVKKEEETVEGDAKNKPANKEPAKKVSKDADKTVSIDEFSASFQLPKGLVRNSKRDIKVDNSKGGLFSLAVFFEDDPKSRRPGVVFGPERAFSIAGTFADTEGLTPERQLTILRSGGEDSDAVYSKDSDFKIGEIAAKRLEYRAKSAVTPDDGKGHAQVIYLFVRPGVIFVVRAGIAGADDKTAQAYFKELDQAMSKMKFTEGAKEKK
jgi:hypothetical protein